MNADTINLVQACKQAAQTLETIGTLASCAPHDDELRAEAEFKKIMFTAYTERRMLLRAIEALESKP